MITIICMGAVMAIYVNHKSNTYTVNSMFSNVEALAAGNDSSDDCTYKNGYRKFSGSKGGAYDCCKRWRNGNGSEDCF